MPKKIKEVENENETKAVKAPPQPSKTDIAERVKTKAEQMKANLEAQPKVSILIPLEKGEKKGAKQPFTINGYRFEVPKGQMTQVPEQVAQMISERFNIELDVRSRSIDQKSSDVQDALS